MKDRTLGVVFALLSGACAFAGQNKGQPADPAKGINLYSPSQEITLGKMLALEVESTARTITDGPIAEYVNRLGQNLARQAGVHGPLVVKVLNSDDPNAVALPGGFLYVNKGLLLQAQNEAEVAGALAHEIAHVAARHATKLATRADILNYATLPMMAVGGFPAFALHQALGFAAPVSLLGFSRGMERQADELALEYMRKAGYDQVAFVDLLERLEAFDSKKGTSVFSTHPKTSKRIQLAQKFIQRSGPGAGEYVLDTSEFQRIKERLKFRYDRHPAFGIYVVPPVPTEAPHPVLRPRVVSIGARPK
jgi:predicted Zn-dependent protease